MSPQIAPDSCDRRWIEAEAELRDIAEPLLDAPSFNRLGGITFLGALSPRFANVIKPPVSKERLSQMGTNYNDGSRRSHSIGVASITRQIGHKIGFNDTQLRYAVAWGLLHDLGNWPLSHTAQHAFTNLLGVGTKTVREWLITDHDLAPRKYRTADALVAAGLEPERLLGLFRKRPDPELAPVLVVTRSRLTPDMLEGVWRAGRTFGIAAPDPLKFIDAFSCNLFDEIFVEGRYKQDVIDFWKTKSSIYKEVFSAWDVVKWESAWSEAVFRLLSDNNLTLESSLEIEESKLVEMVCEQGLPSSNEIYRWKDPVAQKVAKSIPDDLYVSNLDSYLLEVPKTRKSRNAH